jgi:hypothetical protein
MSFDRRSVHEWINSIVAVLALVASVTSSFFTWQANESNREALIMTAVPNTACGVEFDGSPDGGRIGLCWTVTITN